MKQTVSKNCRNTTNAQSAPRVLTFVAAVLPYSTVLRPAICVQKSRKPTTTGIQKGLELMESIGKNSKNMKECENQGLFHKLHWGVDMSLHEKNTESFFFWARLF